MNGLYFVLSVLVAFAYLHFNNYAIQKYRRPMAFIVYLSSTTMYVVFLIVLMNNIK